jgi:hypothetical protein
VPGSTDIFWLYNNTASGDGLFMQAHDQHCAIGEIAKNNILNVRLIIPPHLWEDEHVRDVRSHWFLTYCRIRLLRIR